MRRPLPCLSLVVGLCTVMIVSAGCDGLLERADRGLDAFEQGVKTFGEAAGTFEELKTELEDLKDNLDDGVYKRQVDELIHDVGQVAGMTGTHMIDFTRARVKEDLLDIVGKLSGEDPPARTPVITVPDLKEIRFTDPGRGAVRVVGWNLNEASDAPDQYWVEIETGGAARRVPDEFVSYAGQYAVSVDLSSSGHPLEFGDRSLSFVGYDGEFAIPITGSDPPKPRLVAARGSVETGPKHAHLRRQDCEVDSDDNTLVSVSYKLRPSADKRAVEARLDWSVYECNHDGSCNKTHIQSLRDWHRVWAVGDDYSSITEITTNAQGKKQEWFRGENHGFRGFPNVAGLSDIEVRFDERNGNLLQNGNDCSIQQLKGELNFTVLAVPER